MIISSIDILCQLITPRISNKFGAIRVAVLMQIPAVAVVSMRISMPENYVIQLVATVVMAIDASMFYTLIF